MRSRSQFSLKVGSALREAREQQGVSQRRLALRAGTSQDAIGRIECGVETPTLERFAQLLLVLGRKPVFSIELLESPVPGPELAVGLEMTADERLLEAASWNLVASRLAIAGEQAREEDHPATRRRARDD